MIRRRSRRVVRVGFAVELLQTWATKGHRRDASVTVEGLPPAAQLAGVYVEWDRTVWLLFTHRSFAPVALGEEVPILDCIIERGEALA